MGKEITSTQNPLVKEVLQLRERSFRDERGSFLIEGYREILRSVVGGWKIERLFVCQELFLGTNETALVAQVLAQGEVELIVASEKVFRKISYRDRPDGLLAIAPQKARSLDALFASQAPESPPFYVVAEAIEKPGNLGTILRSSDAVGVSGLIVCDRCTDIYNPNVVRASVGTLFTVPLAEGSSDEVILRLKKENIAILAATPAATLSFTEVNLKGPVAIAVGTEQLGLSKRWLQEADLQVSIPMRGVADSLNVAMATTLLLYEVLRQRQTVKE